MAELARRRIKVLEDKGKQSFKTAMKADLVIAGSAVCASWIGENHFKKFHHSNLSKSVLWTPATTRVAALYSATDVYVMNSQGLGETFGRVTFEVMAFGLPVLGTEARGTKEIVEHNVTGLLHPVGHDGTRGLAENLRFLLKIRGRCIEGGSYKPEGRGRADEGAAEGPGRGDEDMSREGARTCTSHTDVRPPNLTTSTSSCSTFDLKAIWPRQSQ
ncbi:hypothetical protein ACFX2I_022262 [Malus domestica]